MKKIGIVTFHSAHNYGAMLQVYSLQYVIKSLNYDVEVINYRNKEIDDQYKVFNINKNNIKSIVKSILTSIVFYPKNKKRYKVFDKFMSDKLNLSKKYMNIDQLKKNPPKYDVYITGSDQVWNYGIVGELSDAYTLNFGDKDIKRISYAASIGDVNLVSEYNLEYKNKLKSLNYISVREETAKQSLAKIIDRPIEVVLDPTLLLEKEDWDNVLEIQTKGHGKYILAYVVEYNEEYVKIVNYLSRVTGLKVIYFEKRNKNYDNVYKSAYTEGPFEFVNLIRNAEYIVATSFHATVFSIIFEKKFFVVPHVKTGDRVTNLLQKLNISDRAVYDINNFMSLDFKSDLCYEDVKSLLKKEKEKSISWIMEVLKD